VIFKSSLVQTLQHPALPGAEAQIADGAEAAVHFIAPCFAQPGTVYGTGL